ncbi:25005_t:CDS:1, partial [Racocetra persica]
MHKTLNMLLKDFITDAKSKIESPKYETFMDTEINNPLVTRHKEKPPKRYKSNVEITQFKREDNTINERNQDTTHNRK